MSLSAIFDKHWNTFNEPISIDLLHDVSLRSDTNRMNAFNLAMMICPNLVKGSNPLRDVLMCSVPLPASMSPSSGAGMSAGSAADTFGNGNADEGKTTLGMVITLCINRYYEVFDEYVDRSEAVKPWRTFGLVGHPADVPDEGPRGAGAGANGNGHAAENAAVTYVLGEDEDLDDESASALQNDAQKLHTTGAPELSPTRFTFARRQRQVVDGNLNAQNPSSPVRSLFNTSASGSPSAWTARQNSSSPLYTNGKAKSMISIEPPGSHTNGNTPIGTVRRGGSIAIGRGTARKGSGSAVEAVGVTAAGFFVPPSGDSVPQLHAPPERTTATGEGGDVDEEERVNVAERRRMFENSTAG